MAFQIMYMSDNQNLHSLYIYFFCKVNATMVVLVNNIVIYKNLVATVDFFTCPLLYRNRSRLPERNKVDLHGLHVEEALQVVQEKLYEFRGQFGNVSIISVS